ncbi:formin-like protein 14 [Cannabis sativa]|uniref:formin-like protein 14 n=1 Tax=Cannabis sativa TaxID=3483 RepID=UPI0029C9EC91|nr:formin-like protein 14 [Cannabis sativa]
MQINQNSATLRLRRSSSSYPDLRQESVWDDNRDDQKFQFLFFDDFDIKKYRQTVSFDHRHRSRQRSKVEEDEIKEVPVDTFVVRPSTPPKSPAPPPPPPPPPRRTEKVEKLDENCEGDREFTKARSPPPTPPPLPALPPPPAKPKNHLIWRRTYQLGEWTEMVEKPDENGDRESLQQTQVLGATNLEASNNYNIVEFTKARSPPPMPPPPPRPPPSPARIRLNQKKLERIQSNLQSHYTKVPPPPPPPPFKMPEFKYLVSGDFVKIKSAQSSRCDSPDPMDEAVSSSITEEESESVNMINGGDGLGSVFCPSPDVLTSRSALSLKGCSCTMGGGLRRL